MGEQTTFVLKSFVVFLILYIASGIYSMYLDGFALTAYDMFAVYGLMLLSVFLLISNSVVGYVLSFISLGWVLFNPDGVMYLTQGLLFDMLGSMTAVSIIEFSLLCAVFVFVLVAMILRFAKIRNVAVEAVFGIYIMLYSILVLSGVFSGILFGAEMTLIFFAPAIIAFLAYVILFLIGYLVNKKSI